MSQENRRSDGTPNLAISGGLGIGAVVVGQQTIRSGVPRLLGVRLESHSTSNKNARDILNNGGYLDPNKSGTAATRGLEAGQGRIGVTDLAKAKGKVYITGVRPDSIARTRVSPFDASRSIRIDPKNQNIIQQLLERKLRRNSYRSQAYLDWDKINSAGDYKQIQAVKNRERAKQMLYGQLMPWRGRSLYIGGSDRSFMDKFKPDFDDPGAQYSDRKVKVYGNRFAATAAAIEKEGLGNLMRANKGRVAAGALILGVGGTATVALATAALKATPRSGGSLQVEGVKTASDGSVKGYKRRTKTGKITIVRGFKRKIARAKK